MMSGKLKKHWSFVHLFISTNLTQRLALLNTITDDQLAVICEVVLNTLHGHLYVQPAIVKSLRRHKALLRGLASHDFGKNKKRALVLKNHRLITRMLVTLYPLLEAHIKS